MLQNDSEWYVFAITGKVEDYLKYRHKETLIDATKEKELNERHIFCDGNGTTNHAYWGI